MNSSYICYNLVDLCDEINAPLRQTQRIQYTCLDASSNYIVLGATSGSIYLFRRTPSAVQFLQIIQNMYGPINHVAISPQEKFVTFSTVKGTICVYVIDLTAAYPQIVTAHYEDTQVTCLHWRRSEEQLFYGDQKGNVFVVNLTSFLGRNLTHISIHPILFLDSAIVQISDLDKLLLVSNYAKCILCNTDNEEFKQIGNTPRDGYYGACFLPAANKIHLADAKVFCARPGSRLWEADVEGRVLQTSQYKLTAAMTATASFNGPHKLSPCPVLPAVELDSELGVPPANASASGIVDHQQPPPQQQQQQQQLKKPPQLLHRLQPIFGRFVFSYNRNGFYIFDPQRTSIVMWNDQIRDIQSVRIVNGATLVIFTNHRQVFSIACRSLEDGFVDLLAEQQLDVAARLLTGNAAYFRELCLTQGYVAHILRLKQQLADARVPLSGDCATVLDEFGGLVDADDTASAAATAAALLAERVGRRHEGGVYTVDNKFVHGVQYRAHRTTGAAAVGPGDENIRTVLMSASRNIFNKFNIFNEPPAEPSPQRRAAASVAGVAGQRASSPVIIPYQNVDMSQPPGEIIAQPVRVRRRPSSVPPAPPVSAAAAAVVPPPVPARPQLSAEERQLQSLYMIYKTARMSNLQLVERYAGLFDKYDCAGIRTMLGKLAAIMRLNGVPADTALAHCYELYFNYLQPELVWEMDDAMRDYVVAGFVLVNRQIDGNDLERCERCAYPLWLPVARARQARYRELGAMIVKYFWTRNQAGRGFELAAAVPWTMELCCKYQLQHAPVATANGDETGAAAAAAGAPDDRRLLRNLFACGSADLLQLAIDQSDRFTLELWHQFAELQIVLHGQSRMWCARCDGGAQPQPQAVNSEALLRNDFYAWPRLLDNLVQHIRGRNAIALVRKFAERIGDEVIPKEFYLKCLLVP